MASLQGFFVRPKRIRIYVGGRELTAESSVVTSEEGMRVAQKLKEDGQLLRGPYGEFYVGLDPDVVEAILSYLDASVLDCADRHVRDVKVAADHLGLTGLATLCDKRLGRAHSRADRVHNLEQSAAGNGGTHSDASSEDRPPTAEAVAAAAAKAQAKDDEGAKWNSEATPFQPKKDPKLVLREEVTRAVKGDARVTAGRQERNAPESRRGAAVKASATPDPVVSDDDPSDDPTPPKKAGPPSTGLPWQRRDVRKAEGAMKKENVSVPADPSHSQRRGGNTATKDRREEHRGVKKSSRTSRADDQETSGFTLLNLYPIKAMEEHRSSRGTKKEDVSSDDFEVLSDDGTRVARGRDSNRPRTSRIDFVIGRGSPHHNDRTRNAARREGKAGQREAHRHRSPSEEPRGGRVQRNTRGKAPFVDNPRAKKNADLDIDGFPI